jgi:hypothetical protein
MKLVCEQIPSDRMYEYFVLCYLFIYFVLSLISFFVSLFYPPLFFSLYRFLCIVFSFMSSLFSAFALCSFSIFPSFPFSFFLVTSLSLVDFSPLFRSFFLPFHLVCLCVHHDTTHIPVSSRRTSPPSVAHDEEESP